METDVEVLAVNESESLDPQIIYGKLLLLCESKNHSTESPPRALISLQKSVVFGAMKQHGIQQLIVTYHGGGDSGDFSLGTVTLLLKAI